MRLLPRVRFPGRPAVFAGLVFAAAACGQPKPDEPKAEGVFLSAKEYQALLDAAEAAKKAAAGKPAAPSECHVAAKVELRGGKPVAVLVMNYAFRTTAPRQVVSLGLQKAFLISAVQANGKLPLLAAGDDGLTVTIDAAGEHTLTLTAEAAVTARGPKGEPGFDIGLPRAAITTLALDAASAGGKKVGVTPRVPGDREGKKPAADAARYAAKADGRGPPLGPAEGVEVYWETAEAPVPAAETPTAVETDVSIRVDEVTVETLAKLRLRGPPRDWSLLLPPTADVSADRIGILVLRPANPNQPWTVTTPDAGEHTLSVSVRQARPAAGGGTFPGPYVAGPFYAPGVAKQTGSVRLFAPASVAVDFTPPPEVRRQDVPPGDDPPTALFRFAAPPTKDGQPQPLLKFTARAAKGSVTVRPNYSLKLTEAGWKLRAEVRVAPVRTDLDQLMIELPAGWQTLDVSPAELVDEVRPAGGTAYTVKLAAAKREPFDLLCEAIFPVVPTARAVTVPLPGFPQAVSRGAAVTVGVPDGFEVKASAKETDGRTATGRTAELGGTVPSVATGTFDAGVSGLELVWQPYRPELAATLAADVTVTDRQIAVTETVKLTAAEPLPRYLRLTGPAGAVAVRGTPPLTPTGAGEWTVSVPGGAKEVTVTVQFAVPAGAGSSIAAGLFWPDAARVTTKVKVWSGGTRAVAGADAGWQVVPPDAAGDRDWPALTLVSTGAGRPLTLELGEPAAVVIEKAAVQAAVAEDGSAAGRVRYVLKRWPAGGVELIGAGPVPPTVLIDRRRTDAVLPSGAGYRVTLPDPKAGKSTVELDVRFSATTGRTDSEFIPPTIRGAVLKQPVRWQVAVPSGTVPLLGGGLTADLRWAWRGWGFQPGGAFSAADLDAWLAGDAEGDAEGESWVSADDGPTGRQAAVGPVLLAVVPRPAWLAVCSAAAFVAGLLLTKLRAGLVAPSAAVLGLAGVAAAFTAPQPASQVLAAAQPGIVGCLIVIAGQAAAAWVFRRRVERLPSFRRGAVGSSVRPAEPGSVIPAPSGA